MNNYIFTLGIQNEAPRSKLPGIKAKANKPWTVGIVTGAISY
jgi:hypothetical protein